EYAGSPGSPPPPPSGTPTWSTWPAAGEQSEPAVPLIRPISDRAAVRVLGGALAAGAVAQLLFFGELPGINFPIWVAVVLVAAVVFQTYVRNAVALDINWAQLLGRMLFALFAAWLFGGTVMATWLAKRDARADETTEHAGRLGGVEALVLLIAIDAVFALFVALQAAYLFGGLDTLSVTGMTYSDYARRGFFELVTVALLAGGLI